MLKNMFFQARMARKELLCYSAMAKKRESEEERRGKTS
jgi:hypothetical protein